MERLVGEKQDFEFNSLLNREPVKFVTQNRCYVIAFSSE